MDKREKSIRRRNKIFPKAILKLRQIANLSTARYSFTEKELDSMIAEIKSICSYAVECLERRKELNRKS